MGFSCRINNRTVQVESRRVAANCRVPFPCARNRSYALLPAITVCGQLIPLPKKPVTVLRIDQFIEATGIASAEAFGTVHIGDELSITGIASLEAFGQPSASFGILATAIDTAEAFGQATASFIVYATSIGSDEAFGDAVVSTGDVLSVTGIASAEAFGQPTVSFIVYATSISSDEAFGTAVIDGGTVSDAPTLDFSISTNSQNLVLV